MNANFQPFDRTSKRFLNPAALRVAGHGSGGQVVTLASLSPRVPDRFIAQSLALTLHSETAISVLIVQLDLHQGAVPFHEWGGRAFNGEFAFAAHLEELRLGVVRLGLRVSGDPGEALWIGALVQHCQQHFGHVLLLAGSDEPVALLLECLAQSDRAFLLLQPVGSDLYARDLLLRELRKHPRGERANLRTIVCRETGEEHFNELLKQMGEVVHGFVHGCPGPAVAKEIQVWRDPSFQADVRRLAREIGRKRVGLALSSGAARGLAHIGILQVLEENGLEVDVVAGCSMGAYIGAVWAYGLDGVEMERLAREHEGRWGLLHLIDPFILPRQGFLRGEKMKRRLKRSIGDIHFSELARPLRTVATRLSTLERVVFSTGEVASAVHASAAIPGACVPVELAGERYIDGGISDPLPVDVLEEMGIERIIAVNTIPTPAYLRCRLELERERAHRLGRRPRPLRSALNRYLNYFAPGNVLDTIFRSFNGAQMRVAEESCRRADLVLRPLSFDGRWHDFRHPGKYIAIGRREAEERIDEIRTLINRKEPAYESHLTHYSMAGIV